MGDFGVLKFNRSIYPFISFECDDQEDKVNVIDSVFAEMVLDKALLDFRKEKIQQKINQSLRDRNKREFLLLTEELMNVS
ncbi:IDEAL domain-containing protein [Metabacillus sediminilitoris]|uniref:IDEAL domain-containing protein n=1 Tax=Metabacillus sediminilitoris TaxID=2567941 RepID=A0A4S4C1W6_9BACI|nr:IDEAL domain-containing protein [Metabacillus sediminilitoris]QGQ48139.1 IDEAL domain-containing protein [Metabacillus sediminilitoris]THF81498.1 IDEAL domain-containing protein [Metabacillus sediminilitoris]